MIFFFRFRFAVFPVLSTWSQMIWSHTCVPSLCQTNRAGRKFFLILFFPLWLTEALPTQRLAELGELCPRVYLYAGVWAASPTLGCIRPLTHYAHRRIQTGHSFRSSGSERRAWRVRRLNGTFCVCVSFTGSVRGDGDHLHGGRAALQQHVQVQSEGLQRQRSGPVQQDPDHADLWEYVRRRLLSPRL